MNYRMISRILAALLALAILMTMAALAEDGDAADALSIEDEEIAIEGAALELSDDFIELDLGEDLDVLSTDLDADALSGGVLPETDETQDNVSATQLVLGVKEQYVLDAEAIGSGRKVSFSTSNKKVATVSTKGVIKGVKRGSATITCKVGGNAVAKYKVKVVPAPDEVSLAKSSVTLGVKEKVTLTPAIPEGTHASFTWATKNKAVATVTQDGRITGKRAGNTTVTVTTQNGRTAKVAVTVKKAPGSVTLNKTVAKLKVKGTVQLKATLPSNTYSAITWTSSDKKIAKVSANGKVTAVSVGTATITASTYNGCTASCRVTVQADPGSVRYRALLIGEEYFISGGSEDIATRNRGDVANMAQMLDSIHGTDGGKFSITKKYDLTANQTLRAIKTTFADADEDDVSLFFIATHGDADYSGEYAGYLAMSPTGELMLSDLAAALQAVPGKVIVILESCGAGAAVYANNGSKSNQTLYQEYKQATEAFDASVIKAFASLDTGIQANTGEFRVENKFYVLTASRYQELSWGWETGTPEGSFNYFTLWLTQGIGTSGSMPADANNNGQTTLKELYQYISDVGDDYPFRSGSKVYYQHVQAYPANSNFVLFCR